MFLDVFDGWEMKGWELCRIWCFFVLCLVFVMVCGVEGSCVFVVGGICRVGGIVLRGGVWKVLFCIVG